MRDARSNRDRADVDVAIIDQPVFLAGFDIAAAVRAGIVRDSANSPGREVDFVGSSGRSISPARSTPTLGAMNSHGSSQAMSGRSQSRAGATVIRVCGAFGGCF
jgi:hypothetical protein